MENIEKKNVEIGASWASNTVKKFEIGKSKLSDKETQEATKKADELSKIEKNFETKRPEAASPTDIIPNHIATTDSIDTTIKNLNRPEAEKWIAQAYTNIDTTIKNSKNEKGIAGFLGKIMNKILG